MTLPTLNFLTSDSGFWDYRPAVNATGDTVVFERTPVGGGAAALTTLYQIADFSAPIPAPFLSGASPPQPASQTRPDWCWATGQIAFNGADSNNGALSVWQVGPDGANPQPIANTTGFCYPTWSLDGALIVSESSAPTNEPRPRNAIFDIATSSVTKPNIDGADPISTPLFGGMPTVGPNNLPQIAFAGQPKLGGWAGTDIANPVYSQDLNYIFLNAATNGGFASAPMESGAPLTNFSPDYQARAPAWSPDGKTIAFESNRPFGGQTNGGNNYAIYLYNLASKSITQVTDPSLGGQHAKFFPCGKKLILCIHHPGGTPATMGIAWVDISGLLAG